jgi:Ca2+-binding EF-hand superfamily protein
MKKIDLGEFTCFTRDFQVSLPRTKITEVFRKSAVNLQDMTFENFTTAISELGDHYSKAKLRENQERLKELNMVAKKLRIPEEYPNTMRS